MTKTRSYSELRCLSSFEERFDYLRLGSTVGTPTFGFDRWINQRFYTSTEWKNIRNEVIVRDNGCDLGIPGYEVQVGLLIHHMNPMGPDDIIHGYDEILDPEFLITTTQNTHNAIHYSNDTLIPKVVVARSPNDTKLW